MKKRTATVFVTSLAALTALAACSKPIPPGQVSDRVAAEAPKESATLGAVIDDTAITAKVKSRLGSDSRTQNAAIGVETNNGIVTLEGTVAKRDTVEAAEELARNVAQVKGVDNRIVAPSAVDALADRAETAADKAGTAVTDTVITTRVKAALATDDRIEGSDISVHTNAGRVVLSGAVASPSVRDRAIELARQTDGVHKVESTALKVAAK